MIISFAHTTPALIAGRKTVTRRHWAASHAAKFTAGKVIDAWSQLPYVAGAQQVARIRLTADAVLEPLSAMPDSDYEGEGFAWLYQESDRHSKNPVRIPKELWGIRGLTRDDLAPWRFKFMQSLDLTLWVVRFELMEVL